MADRLEINEKLVNQDEINGFVKSRRIFDVLEELIKLLKNGKRIMRLLVDFKKANNHCRIRKLLMIIEERFGPEVSNEVEIVKQIL